MARRLAAIMFTDIAGYTALAQADEAGALKLLQDQDRLVRPTLDAHRGRKVKSIGDGLLIEFPDALDAVECGVELQRRIHEHNSDEKARPLRVRIGIHLGDVQHRGIDILGDAVNIASRLEGFAETGGVCLSAQVYDQVRNKVPYQIEKVGPKALKGVREPVDVYRVILPWVVPDIPVEGAAPRCLAVLPLANISPDSGDEYFADGLTEEIISTISKIRQLAVISRTSVMRYKNQSKSIIDIGRELNAGTILQGSVRKAGNRVRIAVQMLDAVHDRHLWAESYDRGLEDIFAVQGEIAQQVARELEVHLRKDEEERVARAPTQDPEAHLLYLRGLAHQHDWTKEELLQAVDCFERAIQRDSRFALAHAGIALSYGLLASTEALPLGDALPKIKEASRKALELDGSLAEAHLALYQVLYNSWDTQAAFAEVQRALHLNPNLALAHGYAAWAWLCQGQSREAHAEAEKAISLDPLSTEILQLAGTVYLYSGSPQKSEEIFRRIVTMAPTNSFAVDNLGLSQVFLGRYEEGIREIRRSIEMDSSSGPMNRADLVFALTKAGRVPEAREVLAELVRYHEEHGRGAFSVASAFANVGDRERAFEWLEIAFGEHSPTLPNILLEPSFLSLASDPRFQSLLDRVLRGSTVAAPTPR